MTMMPENVWDDFQWTDDHLRTVPMQMGSIYCSAPFIFEHGVHYQKCTQINPVIALQCRFAFPTKQEATRVNELRNSDMLKVTTCIAETIREACDRGEVRLPSIEELKHAEQRIRMSTAQFASGRQEVNIFSDLPPPDST